MILSLPGGTHRGNPVYFLVEFEHNGPNLLENPEAVIAFVFLLEVRETLKFRLHSFAALSPDDAINSNGGILGEDNTLHDVALNFFYE